jgi:NAD(P)-dependent dehydrogenase (short-subunit alcohol dehydrogenase family)
MSRLEGKVAVVTGAASGLGRAVAQRFVAEGARVVLGDLNVPGCEETVQAMAPEHRANARVVKLDVTVEEDARAAVAIAVATWGALHIMVANAGIGAPGLISKLRKEDFERVVAVNLTGVFLCMKAAFGPMKEAGGGALLTMSSVAGMQGSVGLGGYGPSKAGAVQLTQTLALEGARHQIRANVLCPVWTQTPMVDAFVKGMKTGDDVGRARLVADIPLGRLGKPEDVASAAVFLCSDEASFITGVVLPVDGGHLAGRLAAG